MVSACTAAADAVSLHRGRGFPHIFKGCKKNKAVEDVALKEREVATLKIKQNEKKCLHFATLNGSLTQNLCSITASPAIR